MKKKTNRDLVFALWILGTVLFIWGHSMAPASVSGGESSGVADLIRKIFGEESAFAKWAIQYIRKIAHFSEYFLLGFECAIWSSFSEKKRRNAVVFSLGGILVALADEGIQFLTEGRVASFADVGIDLCGFFSAALIVWVVALILSFRRSKEK